MNAKVISVVFPLLSVNFFYAQTYSIIDLLLPATNAAEPGKCAGFYTSLSSG